ncbi:MAG: hypothetical protein HY764_00195 [Candidatus Portnoybacteria bacterium]|nr:hypothetical protein [Candidatus Portnoybacteria bacterium]
MDPQNFENPQPEKTEAELQEYLAKKEAQETLNHSPLYKNLPPEEQEKLVEDVFSHHYKDTENPVSKNEELEKIRQEIVGLKQTELEKRVDEFEKKVRNSDYKPEYNPDIIELDPAALTEKDLLIYQKFREKTLGKEEFLNWQSQFFEKNNSGERRHLAGWLGNKLMSPENQEWFDPEHYKIIYGEAREK